jgi:hypothetical protein
MPVLPAMTADTTESGYQSCTCTDCATKGETCGAINSTSDWELRCYDNYTATLYPLNDPENKDIYHCEPCDEYSLSVDNNLTAQVRKNGNNIQVRNTDKCYQTAYFYYDDELVYNREALENNSEKYVTTKLPYLNPANQPIQNQSYIQTWMNNKGYSNLYFNGIYYLDESYNKIFLYDQDYNPTDAIITDPDLDTLHLDLLDIQWDISVCKSTDVKDCSTPQTMYATDPTITYDVPLGYNCTALTSEDKNTLYFEGTDNPTIFETVCSDSSTCWYITTSPEPLKVYAQLTPNNYDLQFTCPEDPSKNSTITGIQINTTISKPNFSCDPDRQNGWKVDTTNTEILCTDGTQDCLTKTYFSSSTSETLEMVPKKDNTITFIPNFESAVFKDNHGTFILK